MNEPTAKRKASSERTVIWSWRCMSSACNSSICIWLGIAHLTCRGGTMGFFFVRNFFFPDNTRVRIFIFVVAQKGEFFFQNLPLGYMTKTLNQIIIFFLHQNQNIFSATFKPSPPLFKLNGRSLSILLSNFWSKFAVENPKLFYLH